MQLQIHRGYEPGLIGRVAELHGRYYADVWGSGFGFEAQMAREFSDFIEHYDPAKDLVLSAHLDGVLAGSISMLGHPAPAGVQLRFFIVDPAFHGRGAGRALLDCALQWARDRRFPKVFLWTVDHLPQSRRMYDRAGFRVTERALDDRYTLPLESLRLELVLP